MSTRRCVIYARISVSAEESVSIARQLEAARQYAASRGWQVVAEFTDDGVSASRNKPEDRAGWRALLDSSERYDAVIVWKIDRLARKVLDFLNAHEALRARNAGIVAVEDPVDMTTAQGRAFATLLAVFGEMEAESTRARVKAARRFLVRAGRVPGGTLPYGWRSVPNPDGPGLVLAQDPDRVGYVRSAVERTLRGDSIYSTVQWLDEVNAPLPSASQNRRTRKGWSYTTVERLLRNPVLAGMTAYNPGNTTGVRGEDVLRDTETGLPVVDESVAIMPVSEWRGMVKNLDERDSAQAIPRALKATTSPLLSGLIRCGVCRTAEGDSVRMHRGTVQGRHGYSCPKCHQTISKMEDFIISEFLRMKGERLRWSVVEEVHEGGAALLPEIEQRLSELSVQLQATDDDDEAERLTVQMSSLRQLRRDSRSKNPVREWRAVRGEQTFGEDWADAVDHEDRRAVLDDALESIEVVRGRVGRGLDTSRLTFNWKLPEDMGPIAVPDDATLAEWAEE
ncbi:recombinase family protein [Arthrobacter sp. BF1]|uniref:recombinase family protein n=1 Tax=Arthrobacter sp. BF1 TaxID=2821145 RepID=UPI002119B79E|nr:recombinase family protein [Arthrobacter sp. BF1]